MHDADVSVFFGITIRMFFSEHPPPHFHASYQRYRALIFIFDRWYPSWIVREWTARHKAELLENWNRARARLPLQRIPEADIDE